MGKKTLILSQSQIDEICGGDSSYLDGLALTPDMENVYGNEVSAEGAVENGYAEPMTTDDFSHDLTNDWRGNAKLHGMGPCALREMTLKEWKIRNLNEGNGRLEHMQFGAQNGEKGKSYGATKMNLSRLHRAEEKSRNGASPEEKAKAAQTVQKMKNNWSGIESAEVQYNAAKINDKTNRQNKPEGTVITSSPKQSGNGLGHSNGVITK